LITKNLISSHPQIKFSVLLVIIFPPYHDSIITPKKMDNHWQYQPWNWWRTKASS